MAFGGGGVFFALVQKLVSVHVGVMCLLSFSLHMNTKYA